MTKSDLERCAEVAREYERTYSPDDSPADAARKIAAGILALHASCSAAVRGNTEELHDCPRCGRETPHEVHDSGHERDDSGSWRECKVCEAFWSGMTGEYDCYEEMALAPLTIMMPV